MAKAKKYKFKKEFSDARIVIPGLPEITKDTLTDELGDFIYSQEHLKHNIELVGGEEEESEEKPSSRSKKSSDKDVNEG